jgi:hypothetical protein
VGAAALALGALALRWGWFAPLDAARRGVPIFWLSKIALLAAPGFCILGLLFIVFGDASFLRRWIEVEGEDRVSPRAIWFIVFGMIPGAILYGILSWKLNEMGYRER